MCDGAAGWTDGCLNICNQRLLSKDADELEQMKRNRKRMVMKEVGCSRGKTVDTEPGESELARRVGRTGDDNSLSMDQGSRQGRGLDLLCMHSSSGQKAANGGSY